jgi:drug/metabolite transporter (DMT)-like permease
MSLLFALMSAFSNAGTSVTQRLANVSAPESSRGTWRVALWLIRQPLWLLGVLLMGLTFAFQAVALYFGGLATVQPLLVTELIFTLLLRQFWLRDRIAPRTWAAAFVMCAGLAGFLLVAHPTEGHRTPTGGAWALALGTRGALVLVVIALGLRGSPVRRAALLGTAAALVWSVDAAFVKATTDLLARDGWSSLLSHWPLYAALASGVIGTVLVEAAFTAGPLNASQPALLIVDPLASISLGIELFGEHLNHSAAAVIGQVAGLLVMATGVALLTAWAPPVMTPHKSTLETRGRAPAVAADPAPP